MSTRPATIELRLMNSLIQFILLNLMRAVLVLLVACTLSAWAEPVVVVTQDGSSVTTLSRDEVADLFLGRRIITISGQDLIPLDVNDESLREAFYQGVANMSTLRVNAYWARLVFSARGRPPPKLSLSEVKRVVLYKPGLVTYLPADDAKGFKIILTVQ
jgi:hypothetical protein